ncbi:DUF6517 family protein [Haloarculaceae archaeon H-GB2-1]|nr:DUF6517 family protein [Haloarculaceae archaeon H-GB1-1]MEA5386088.1 DUF6517 family protein [Haloarculaceae archaeon H-GB11]MEA5407594.1 DUF6517 family protein [Haloarculaceae archaeon H-GB2-1]
MFDSRTSTALALCALLVTSGCLGANGGQLTFSSSPTTVEETVLSETGYELTKNRTFHRQQNVTAAGQTVTVNVTNHQRQYDHTIDLGMFGEKRFATFVVLTTPAVDVAGQTLNPVGDWSNRRLVRELIQQYKGVSNVEHVTNRTVRSLGEDRTVNKFEADSSFEGIDMTVFVHVTSFKHGDDYVIAVAIHPKQIESEQDRVDKLLRGLNHNATAA